MRRRQFLTTTAKALAVLFAAPIILPQVRPIEVWGEMPQVLVLGGEPQFTEVEFVLPEEDHIRMAKALRKSSQLRMERDAQQILDYGFVGGTIE